MKRLAALALAAIIATNCAIDPDPQPSPNCLYTGPGPGSASIGRPPCLLADAGTD